MIAERAVEYFRSQRLIEVPLCGLVVSLATSARGRPLRDTLQGRAVIRLINHKLLIEFLRQDDGAFRSQADIPAIRAVYNEVENLLSDDYHFWLQRASFETEEGDLDAANNFIRQARGLNPEDPYVRTQWAYTTIKTAANSLDDPAWNTMSPRRSMNLKRRSSSAAVLMRTLPHLRKPGPCVVKARAADAG